MTKECSKERGCQGKTNLGGNLITASRYADALQREHGKNYGIYLCPHCGGHHLTTKLDKRDEYRELLYATVKKIESASDERSE